MPILIYKRTNASRDIPYQEEMLGKLALPEDAKIYFDDDRDLMLRPTTRNGKIVINSGSFALFADNEKDMEYFLKGCKTRKATLVGGEENYTWTPNLPANHAISKWLAARKAGASMRGSKKSADTRKAITAAKLALIEDDLKRDEHTTRQLLDRVGVKSVNSIKNHFGITREQMQGRHQAAQKRKERHEQRTN